MKSRQARRGSRRPAARPRVAMVSTHGYVAAAPPLGAADTGGQVVHVLELSKKLAQLGYEVDIRTRRFDAQPAEEWCQPGVRVARVPWGGDGFIPKEYLPQSVDEWCSAALDRFAAEGIEYVFVNSHYWDGGVAGHALARALETPHVHTPHSQPFGMTAERLSRHGAETARSSFTWTGVAQQLIAPTWQGTPPAIVGQPTNDVELAPPWLPKVQR